MSIVLDMIPVRGIFAFQIEEEEEEEEDFVTEAQDHSIAHDVMY